MLSTPIDPKAELGEAPLSGRRQLTLVGSVTTAMGLASSLLIPLPVAGRGRLIVLAYAMATTLLGLLFVIAGRAAGNRTVMEREDRDVESAVGR